MEGPFRSKEYSSKPNGRQTGRRSNAVNGGRSEHSGVCSDVKELEDVQRFWMALKERSRILKTSEAVILD